jgi:hypothetical protein
MHKNNLSLPKGTYINRLDNLTVPKKFLSFDKPPFKGKFMN